MSIALPLVLVGCSRSSSGGVWVPVLSTPAERCRWTCEQALSRETDRLLARRGPVNVAALQVLFEEEDLCRTKCGDG